MRALLRILAACAALLAPAAAQAAVPVLADFTQHRGQLTRAGHGAVGLTRKDAPLLGGPSAPASWMMQASGGVPTSCTLAFVSAPAGGSASEWTLTATDCTSPKPAANGVTAGTWVFDVTATNADGSDTEQLTIITDADTYTVAAPTEVSSTSTGLRAIEDSLGGKTIAVARGSEVAFAGNAEIALQAGSNTAPDFSKALVLTKFQASSGRIALTSEDAANPSTIGRLQITGGGRIDVSDLEIHSYLAQYVPSPSDCSGTVAPTCGNRNTTQGNALVFLNGSSANGWPDDVTFTDVNVGAPAWATSDTQWFTAFKTSGPSAGSVRNLHLDGMDIVRALDGIVPTTVADSTFENITIDRFVSDAIFLDGDNYNLVFQDIVTVRPTYHVTKPAEHWDHLQMGGNSVGSPGTELEFAL